jgi:hypothetical protein
MGLFPECLSKMTFFGHFGSFGSEKVKILKKMNPIPLAKPSNMA